MNKDKIVNYYDLIPDRLIPKYHNPAFEKHGISVPFRMLIVGGSGSGKTNLIMEIIGRMPDTFQKLVLCVKNKDEPLYNFLSEQLKDDELEIYEGIDNVPPVETFDKCDDQILIVFDDLVLERNQSVIEQYFIRGRKIAGGISCAYLTQSYFQTPKTIRIQCNYILLKKLQSEKDLNLILSEFSLGLDKKTLLKLYKYATNDQLSFLMIDIGATAENRFRKNFLEIVR